MWTTVITLALVTVAAGRPDLWDTFQSFDVGLGDVVESSDSGEAGTVEPSNPGEATTIRVDSSGSGENGTNACLEPVQTGICRASIKRWAFDEKTAGCRAFTWGGCGGTANNFRTKADCLAQCGPLVEAVSRCADLPDCPDTCERRQNAHTGCLQCHCSVALPAGRSACSLPVDQGRCRAAIPRFAFQAGVCQKFLYGGCQGNDNNFETRAACERACGAGARPGRAGFGF